MNKTSSDIRIAAQLPNTILGLVLKFFSPLLDHLLGIRKLRKLYLEKSLSGLDKQAFSEKLLKALGVSIAGGDELLKKFPRPVLVLWCVIILMA